MDNLITRICQIAILINTCILIVSIPYGRADLACLSVINIALLSTRFIFKGVNKV